MTYNEEVEKIRKNWFKKVRLYMREKRISKSKMAVLLGISRVSIYNILNENHFPNKKTFLKINKMMKVNYPYIPTKRGKTTILYNPEHN